MNFRQQGTEAKSLLSTFAAAGQVKNLGDLNLPGSASSLEK